VTITTGIRGWWLCRYDRQNAVTGSGDAGGEKRELFQPSFYMLKHDSKTQHRLSCAQLQLNLLFTVCIILHLMMELVSPVMNIQKRHIAMIRSASLTGEGTRLYPSMTWST